MFYFCCCCCWRCWSSSIFFHFESISYAHRVDTHRGTRCTHTPQRKSKKEEGKKRGNTQHQMKGEQKKSQRGEPTDIGDGRWESGIKETFMPVCRRLFSFAFGVVSPVVRCSSLRTWTFASSLPVWGFGNCTTTFRRRSSSRQRCRIHRSNWGPRRGWPTDVWRRTRSRLRRLGGLDRSDPCRVSVRTEWPRLARTWMRPLDRFRTSRWYPCQDLTTANHRVDPCRVRRWASWRDGSVPCFASRDSDRHAWWRFSHRW